MKHAGIDLLLLSHLRVPEAPHSVNELCYLGIDLSWVCLEDHFEEFIGRVVNLIIVLGRRELVGEVPAQFLNDISDLLLVFHSDQGVLPVLKILQVFNGHR